MMSSEFLDNMRYECDPLADEAIEAVACILGKESLKTQNALNTVKRLANQGSTECKRYLEFFEREPPWIGSHVSKFDAGRRFFVRNSPFAGLVLMYGSLVASFTSANGNKVLMATGRLSKHGDIRRRLFETVSFVKDVMLFDDIEDLKRICCKVRLLHSLVRHHIKNSDVKWDNAKYGFPANQQDMAGTLLTFSILVIKSLEKLGINASKTEIDSYLQLWKFVGYYLGTHSDFLCDDGEEAWTLTTTIRTSQCIPDADSCALADALLRTFACQMPFHLSYSLSSQVSCFLIGEDSDLVEQLGLQKTTWSTRLLLNFICGVNVVVTFLQYYIPPLENLMYRFGRFALTSLVHVTLKGRQPAYIMRISKPQ